MCDQEDEFWCPNCGKYFDTPERYITPCCGVDIDSDAESDFEMMVPCPECGRRYNEQTELKVCPYCNDEGADFTGCFPDDVRQERIAELKENEDE